MLVTNQQAWQKQMQIFPGVMPHKLGFKTFLQIQGQENMTSQGKHTKSQKK